MKSVAIFGGTFNPIHWGHLLIAEAALDQLALEQVIWVPTYRPPHKSQGLAAFEHRVVMVQKAIADHPAFQMSEIEATRSGLSFAAATLADLTQLYPNTNWHWITGIDAFQSLPRWRDSHQLASQCSWLVAPRDAQDNTVLCQQVASQFAPTVLVRYHLLQMPQIGISSSLVRQCCQTNRSIRYLVPQAVREYIERYGLYRG